MKSIVSSIDKPDDFIWQHSRLLLLMSGITFGENIFRRASQGIEKRSVGIQDLHGLVNASHLRLGAILSWVVEQDCAMACVELFF